MFPAWLQWIALLSLLAGFACAIWITIDEFQNPQQMWIMNVVWPVCALFGSVFVMGTYLWFGRHVSDAIGKGADAATQQPYSAMAAKAALHCGAGCTLGDILAETLAMLFPTVLLWLGWKTLFLEKTISVWILDYIFAFGFGIAFQYFTITPMRNLSPKEGLVAALRADALSLTAWQIGMYGLMAVAQFLVFQPVFGKQLEANTVEFWFVMQLAMLAGFATSYPVNWWLLNKGFKEKM